MKIPYYQVSAFSESPHGGNPAGVCLLKEWLPDVTLQQIAKENDLSETAYLVPEDGRYRLRWFTPTSEVELCGHATLASAFVVFEQLFWPDQQVEFLTRSGVLSVWRSEAGFTLRLPANSPVACDPPEELLSSLGIRPTGVMKGLRDYYLALYDSEAQVRELSPDFEALEKVDCWGVIATAKGTGDYDFISRFFAPRAGINEDPVTGSAHCILTPYWASVLGKSSLRAWQASTRGGELHCVAKGEKVEISGTAKLYLSGEIFIDQG
jgi:PhzF family phenazine biosynthesis protein